MKKTLLIIILILLYEQLTFSQKKTDANIFGHVVCNCGHKPFATVSIKGTTIGISTDETGHYMLVNLPEGTHTLRAQAVGFKPAEKVITIKNGESIEVNFTIEEDILGLEEVVVTADRSEMKRIESASIVNTLPPALFKSVQAISLSEGLSFTPGLRVENNCQNCGFSQVRMNGLEGPYSQILINSRPIFSGLAGVYGLELIPANMVERVEVVRGGGSALYGSNAIAGTINIILKEPSSNIYEAGVTTALTGIGTKGSAGIAPDYSSNLNTSLVSSDGKTGLSLYGFTRSRAMYDANNDDYSEIAPMQNITLGTRFTHRFSLRNKIAFDFFRINEERNGGNRQEYPLHERDVAEAVKHNITTGALTFEQYLRKYDMLSVFVSAQHLNRDSYYGANRSLASYGNSIDMTYNSGLQYKMVFGNSSLLTGFENTGGKLEDLKLGYPDYANAVIVNDSIISIPHTDNTRVADQRSGTTGFFSQYEFRTDRFKAGVGGRFDHYSITDRIASSGNKTGNIFSPRINLMYKLTGTIQARASYSQGYRAPQIFDEDLHIETSGSRQVINKNDPSLKQETSHSYMASLDFNGLVGTVQTGILAEAFLTDLTNPFVNEIGTPDANGTVIYTRKNAENGATVKGINLEVNFRTLDNLTVNAGFTVQSSRYESTQEFGEHRFFRTPSNYGFIVTDWDFMENFCLSSTYSYTGRMLVPYFGPLTDPETGELKESGNFHDLGIKLTHTFKINGASMQWFAGLKNIFSSYQNDFDTGINRDPAYIYGPLNPRTVYFGIRLGNMLN